MSWPSTFLLATVKMLLLCSLLLAASAGSDSHGRLTFSGYRERVSGILGGGGLTCVEWAVSDLELGFILVGNVFPCGQEHLPVYGVSRMG